MDCYFRSQSGDIMSIQAAVTLGFVYRSAEKGKVVIGKMVHTAKSAIENGYIDQAAADYIAQLPGTNEPAPFIREDAAPPPEPESKATAETTIAALGAFFTAPTLASKQAAAKALEDHLSAVQSK